MDPSSLILLAIIGVWVAYLVPHWLRRRDELSQSRTPDRFSGGLRVLQRRSRTPRPDRSVHRSGDAVLTSPRVVVDADGEFLYIPADRALAAQAQRQAAMAAAEAAAEAEAAEAELDAAEVEALAAEAAAEAENAQLVAAELAAQAAADAEDAARAAADEARSAEAAVQAELEARARAAARAATAARVEIAARVTAGDVRMAPVTAPRSRAGDVVPVTGAPAENEDHVRRAPVPSDGDERLRRASAPTEAPGHARRSSVPADGDEPARRAPAPAEGDGRTRHTSAAPAPIARRHEVEIPDHPSDLELAIASARVAARRRAAIMALLFVATLTSWVVAFASSTPAWVAVPATTLLVLHMLASRVAGLRSREALMLLAVQVHSEELALSRAQRQALVTKRPADAAASGDTAPTPDRVARRAAAVGAATWEPVPVPPPTYTLKPAVHRPEPAPLDLPEAPAAVSRGALPRRAADVERILALESHLDELFEEPKVVNG